MTLTSELKNPRSPINRWFDLHQNQDTVQKIIVRHNNHMCQQPTIKPRFSSNYNWSLVGTAFIYGFRHHLGLFASPILQKQTVAYKYAKNGEFDLLLQAKSTKEQALYCLLLANCEAKYRGTYHREIAMLDFHDPMYQRKLRQLPDYQAWRDMILDLTNLIDSIKDAWQYDLNIRDAIVYLNATLAGSAYIAADAQQIINRDLIRCFTTVKNRPKTVYHFRQQIAYYLLDYDNDYQIQNIVWYYSRQRAVWTYPIAKLFKDWQKSKADFQAMIKSSYGCNDYKEDYFLRRNEEVNYLFGN